MFIIKSKFIHTLISSVALFSIGFSTLAPTVQVFAEELEEETTESNSYDELTNNVAELESGLQNSYKASSEYDIGMQYLVTYNILKSTYLGTNSTYGDIYTKDMSGQAFSGKGSTVKSKVQTGAQNVYTTETGGEANTDLDNDKAEGDVDTSKRDAAAKELAGVVAAEYKKTIDKYYATDVSKFGDGKLYTQTLTSFPDYNNYPKIDGVRTPKWLVKSKDSKAPKVDSTASKAMLASLTDYFYNKIKTSTETKQLDASLNFSTDKFTGGVFNPSGSETSSYFKVYQKALGNKVQYNWNDSFDTQVTFNATIAKLTGRNDLNANEIKARLKVLHHYSGLTTHANGSKEFNKMVSDDFAQKYKSLKSNSKYTKAISTYRDVAGINDVKPINTNGVKTLAWTPILPYYETGIEEFDDFEKALKDAGIETSKATSEHLKLLDENGKDRAAQLGDLFFDKAEKASPVFLGPASNEEAKNLSLLKVGSVATSEGISKSSIGGFIGIKADRGWFFGVGSEFKVMTHDELEKLDSVSRGTFRAVTASKAYKDLSTSSAPLGIDNYGNIIAGETGQVVIPYWHNTLYLEGLSKDKEGSNAFVTHPVYNGNPNDKLASLLNGVLSNTTPREIDITAQAVVDSGLISSTSDVKTAVDNIHTGLSTSSGQSVTTERINKLMTGGEDNLKVMAMLITAGTKDSVKAWNEKYIPLAIENKQMFVGLTSGGFISGEETEESQMDRWTAASLIQKIGLVFDWGFAETIRLTVASALVNFYNSNLASTGLTNIFYTPNITETSEWSSMMEPLALLLLAFTPIYIIYMLFQANRGKATAKDIIKQFVMLALILLIPLSGYGAFTHLLLNEPAEMILGEQLKQTIVMDFYLDSREQNSNADSSYAQLFGTANTDNKFRTSDNYIVTFYTTTDKRGFIIDDFEDTDNVFDAARQEAFTKGNDWNKNRLVSVNVSLFDLFEWGTKRARSTAGEEGGTDQTLFDWLESDNPESYAGVGDYEEYYVDTSTIFDQKNQNILTNVAGQKKTASSLFSDLMLAGRLPKNGVNENAVRDGLESIEQLMLLFSQSNEDYVDSSGNAYYVPTSDDLHAVMRDLSMIGTSRTNSFGTSKYSLFTQSVMENGTKHARFNLDQTVNIPEPDNDIFGIYDTVLSLNPYYNSGQPTAWMDLPTIESMVYDINYDVLSDLATVYSMIPNSTGISSADVDMGSALQMTVVSELFFQLNDELGFKNFPTSYDPGTVSTDNYMKMIYIPFASYELDRANFSNSEVLTNDVAEYIAIRESSFVLILFILAVLALVLYGLFMMAVFYGLMLVMTLYAFIKNYIIKNDYNNKSWLGVLGIYTVLGLVKFGLILVWYVMTALLNGSYLDNGGPTYPYILLHSIAIIAYLLLVSKFVIVKMFNAVYQDKENLGGEAFSSGMSSMRDKLSAKTAFSRGKTRPMGNVAGNSKKRFNDMSKGTGKFAKGANMAKGAGLLAGAAGGYVGSRVYNKLKKQKAIEGSAVNVISNAIDNGKRKYNASRVGQSVNAFGESARNVGRGIKGAGFAVTHPFQAFHNVKNNSKKMGYKNNAHKSIVGNSIDHLGNITKAVNGVSSAAVSVSDTVGKVYDVKNNATATVLTMGSVAGAKAFAEGLSKAGHLVKTDGNRVVVDSSALDLSTTEGRAALVDEGVQNIQQQTQNYDYSMKDTKLTGQQGTPVLFGQDKGSYQLLFDNRSGLSTKYYQQMLNNKEFNENFIVDKSSVQTAIDGSVKPNSMVRVIPKNSAMEPKQVQNIFKNLYNEDTTFRSETKGVPERKQGNYNVLDLSEIPQAQVASYMKDAPTGVMLQGTQLFYNNTNGKQIQFADGIKDNVLLEKRSRQQELVRDRDSIIGYMRDGEGHGVQTQTLSSDNNPQVTQLFGDKIADHSIAFNTGDTVTTNKISSYINTIQKLGDVSNQDRQSFSNIQNVLRSKGDEVMLQQGGLGAVEKSISFLENTTNVSNTPALQSIIKTKEMIDRDVQSGILPQDKADIHYTNLYKNTVKLADDSNRLDDMYLREVKDVDTKIQDNYTTIKETISNKYQIPNDDIDKVRWGANNFENYKDAFGEVKDFKVEGNVGRVNSKTGVNKDKVSKLVAKASETDFKDKNYATDYKPKSTKDVKETQPENKWFKRDKKQNEAKKKAQEEVLKSGK